VSPHEEIGSSSDQQPIAAPSRLREVPGELAPTRQLLHHLAQTVISPARERVTGRIGLRATPGGFGTPRFGDGEQVRVEGTDLVFEDAAGAERREPLEVDERAAAYFADWYAFGADILLALRAHAGAAADPSLIQLWPEHLDIAVELGSEAAGARATYGLSPGDERHAEPYVYVAPWQAPDRGELWGADGFAGAELRYAELISAPDPRAHALEFLERRLAALSE
jgi:hypothetical protein